MSRPIRSRIASSAWCALIGFSIALVACITFGVTVGVIAFIANPNDPSAGSVAEIGALAIPLLTPVGAVIGGIVGWARAARRNRPKSSLPSDA